MFPNPPKLRRFTLFLSPPHALLVLLPFSPLLRRQARDLLPTKFRAKLTRGERKLRAFQLHNWANLGHHGRHRTDPLQDFLCFCLGFKDFVQKRQPSPGDDRCRCFGTSFDQSPSCGKPSLKKVIIWNRTVEKVRNLAEKMQESVAFERVCFESNGCVDEVVGMGDIISCATNSEVPHVKGKKLKARAHLDLVGSFKHSMKECDDEAIRRGRVFVDNEAALVEAGELVGAFGRRVIGKANVCGMLVELIKGDKAGRRICEETTVFKSVGSAVVDILAAQLVYETYMQQNQ